MLTKPAYHIIKGQEIPPQNLNSMSLLGERAFPATASASGVVIHRQSVDEEDEGPKTSPSTPSI